ncbi:MAG TPA: bifunctional pyr operon transcriptional regulator/uracil phosphoribosyltransferase PyrR [Bacteroidia bacterium]|nr:bifunctional pyr operon transcriptional regulator/uracil phosphoribosyltransferase PyrR [Bacteroidia bacterium]
MKELADKNIFGVTLQRLAYQLIENHDDFSNSVIIGLQPRGIYLARRMHTILSEILGTKILLGELDVTFFRDDFRQRDELIIPSSTRVDFIVENRKVILVDDVLFTGRTIRAGLDALQAFGRPAKVELLVLVDRRYSRHVPVEPDYVGIAVDTISSQKVKVSWKETDGEDNIVMISTANK